MKPNLYLSNRLSAVEVQLIMQGLDLKELLILSRCSKFLRCVASHRFPWKYTSPLSFDIFNFINWNEYFHTLYNQSQKYVPLQHASLSADCVSITDITLLIKTLSKYNLNDKLVQLKFNHCFYDFGGIRYISPAIMKLDDILKQHHNLNSVNLGYNSIGYEGVKVLSQFIKNSTAIRNINICYNRIGDEPMQYLSEAIQYNNSIKKINLAGNNITNYGLSILSNGIKVNKTLTCIYLGNNDFDEDEEGGENNFVSMVNAIKFSSSLKEIHFNNNHISDNGFMKIIEAIEFNRNITSINLKDTFFNNLKCIKELSFILKYDKCSITHINLSSNDLDCNCIDILVDAAKFSNSITMMDLSDNIFFIGERSKALIHSIINNKHITNVILKNNEITSLIYEAFNSSNQKEKEKTYTYRDRISSALVTFYSKLFPMQ